MKIKFITGNHKKFEEAVHILEGWDLEHVNIDLEEIQGSRDEVIRAKAKSALGILGAPLILEDVSLCCGALGGMPGPYAKDFLKAMTAERLYRLVSCTGDHSVQAICSAAYIEPGSEPQVFEGIIHGTIVAPAGNTKHGPFSFNTIFKPDGCDKTMGEMTMSEHAQVSHRRLAFQQLRAHFEKHEVK